MRQRKDKNLCLIVLALVFNRQILNLFCFYRKKKSEVGWLWEERELLWPSFPQGILLQEPSSLPSLDLAEDSTSDFHREAEDTQLE